MAVRGGALKCLLLIEACLIGVATPAQTQERVALVGVVRDSAGVPLGQADVGIVALHKLSKTNTEGRFRIDAVPTGVVIVSVRKLGFEPRSVTHAHTADADTLRVALVEKVVTLPGVSVSERDMRRMFWIEDFHRRRMRGIGTYLTREDIAKRRATRVSDALRETPGIRFVRVRGGTGVRFMSAPSNRRDCMPMIWVDGQRAPEMEVDDLPVNEIEGIELYHGPSTTPMQFSQGALTTCGTIVVWSRVPGT
jgi:carboxypeptidase family protein/TonB-dependent receptor-like protein